MRSLSRGAALVAALALAPLCMAQDSLQSYNTDDGLPANGSGSYVGIDVPGSLTTNFIGNNAYAGNTFDIFPARNFEITALDVHNDYAGAQVDVDVYYLVGTCVGNEANAAAWTLLASGSNPAGNGIGLPTNIDICGNGYMFMAGTNYGMYVDFVNYSTSRCRYTNGGPGTVYANADVTLTTNSGQASPAFGSVFNGREWNGTLYYDDTPACLPKPVVYCTGSQGTSSSGCFASIIGSDMTSAPVSGANDYDVLVSTTEATKPGIIFYGYGRALIPFSSGNLCVNPPLKRTPPQNTGGAGGIIAYNDPVAWLAAAGGVLTHSEDFSGFTIDTPFESPAGPVALNGSTIQAFNGVAFRNIVDVPPFQFTDNNGTNNCSSFVDGDCPTTIEVVFPVTVKAWGSGFYGGTSGEVVECAAIESGVEVGTFGPVVNTFDFAGFVASGTIEKVILRAVNANGSCGSGEGFGWDDFEQVTGSGGGGTLPCTGSMILRINDPAGVNHAAGTSVNYQGWTRDPASASGTDVSDALEVVYG